MSSYTIKNIKSIVPEGVKIIYQDFFDISLEECIEKVKLETRRYAKRQLTWFRKNNKINWLEVDKLGQVATKLETFKKIVAKLE